MQMKDVAMKISQHGWTWKTLSRFLLSPMELQQRWNASIISAHQMTAESAFGLKLWVLQLLEVLSTFGYVSAPSI